MTNGPGRGFNSFRDTKEALASLFTVVQPTLTLMILLLKLLSTTTMSSDSAGESVPSWLRPEKESDGEPTGSGRLVGGSRDSSRDCRMRRGRFSTRSPVNLVDFIGASFPHLQDPGARVCLQLEVPLRGGTRETHSVGELW